MFVKFFHGALFLYFLFLSKLFIFSFYFCPKPFLLFIRSYLFLKMGHPRSRSLLPLKNKQDKDFLDLSMTDMSSNEQGQAPYH